jgi:hypothetical protein
MKGTILTIRCMSTRTCPAITIGHTRAMIVPKQGGGILHLI